MVSYQDNLNARVNLELIKSAQKQVGQRKTELKSNLKSIERKEKFKKVILKGLGKIAKKTYEGRVRNRSISRAGPSPTVVVGGDVYSRDKSRFFKEQWEEEKKQLYFK